MGLEDVGNSSREVTLACLGYYGNKLSGRFCCHSHFKKYNFSSIPFDEFITILLFTLQVISSCPLQSIELVAKVSTGIIDLVLSRD